MCVTLSWGVKTFIELTPAVPITRDLIIFNEWLVDMSKKFKLRLNFPTKINDTFTNRQIKWLWGPRRFILKMGKHRSLVTHWLLVPGSCSSNLGGEKISSFVLWVAISQFLFTFELIHDYPKWSIQELSTQETKVIWSHIN